MTVAKIFGKVKQGFFWLRYGTVQERVICRHEGTACEVEFTGRGGRVIGYWAYGVFDPRLPYQG